MKKQNKIFVVFLWSVLILGSSGCSFFEEEKELEKKQETVKDNEGKEFVVPYMDQNPIQLGLYINNNNTRTLTTEFYSPMTIYQDILSLEVYYTQENTFFGNQKTLWNQYTSNYTEIENYKIGYQISFQVGETEFQQNILKPSDTNAIFEYIQIYLYDDINQENGWYDHITEEEITANTIFTSLKLTASTKIEEITSPIIITAFTYDEDDFDESENYRGNSSFQISIYSYSSVKE